MDKEIMKLGYLTKRQVKLTMLKRLVNDRNEFYNDMDNHIHLIQAACDEILDINIKIMELITPLSSDEIPF